jgi:hypothetical protein
MKEVAFAEDDECWNIAERMIEEIGLIKGKKISKRSKYSWPRGGLNRMLMRE